MTRSAWLVSIILMSACASAMAADAIDIPAALRAPSDQSLRLQASAKGVQIYQCTHDAEGRFAWTFKSPEADLSDASGHALGKHFAGPTWQSTDGSRVVGEMKAKDPGPDPSAIPWLLVAAKSNAGTGVFSATKTIQRVATKGGIAPSKACAADNLDEIVKIPYTATYNFYQ